MNPDYMKQQDNPDGKHGHDERNNLYTKNIKPNKEREASERLLNKYLTADEQSFRDLQIEMHMNQCANKTEKCYEFEQRIHCLDCKYFQSV
jgi:enoyl reductase-like protein